MERRCRQVTTTSARSCSVHSIKTRTPKSSPPGVLHQLGTPTMRAIIWDLWRRSSNRDRVVNVGAPSEKLVLCATLGVSHQRWFVQPYHLRHTHHRRLHPCAHSRHGAYAEHWSLSA